MRKGLEQRGQSGGNQDNKAGGKEEEEEEEIAEGNKRKAVVPKMGLEPIRYF